MPGAAGQQFLHDGAADHSADRIADHHQDTARLRQRWLDNSAAAALIDASMPPIPKPVSNRQTSNVGTPSARLAPNMPTDHGKQTTEDGRAPPDLVGDTAEQHGAQAHAHQLHRQNPAERGLVHSPVLRNPGRSEADRQDIESVHGVEAHGDENRQPLACAHGAVIDDRFWSFILHAIHLYVFFYVFLSSRKVALILRIVDEVVERRRVAQRGSGSPPCRIHAHEYSPDRHLELLAGERVRYVQHLVNFVRHMARRIIAAQLLAMRRLSGSSSSRLAAQLDEQRHEKFAARQIQIDDQRIVDLLKHARASGRSPQCRCECHAG